jgi:mannosyl-oligosaccharide alpha-1,2-mannosidase
MPDITTARQKVVGAFQHSWQNYKENAWGHDEIKPVSGVKTTQTHHDWLYMAGTMVDSLSTLWIMGLYKEFAEARDWIEDNLDFETDTYVSLFETNIRILGGLLSAYDLSGEPVFLQKAVEVGDKMMYAFAPPYYFPSPRFNFGTSTGDHRKTRYITQYGFAYDNSYYYSFAEFGTLQLEFTALGERTGDSK